MSERLLDTEGWKEEAQAVINDVKDQVKSIEISTIPSSNSCIFLNVETLEGEKYTFELTVQGFKFCGKGFNENNWENNQYFETVYALLNSVSPRFKEVFMDVLFKKLAYCK
ncbi:GSK3-beta interaction protein [Anthonomus grandis grandis]|uniref:GSK3-beta interaction protein n=1 Tax=Anthonomus grandis grandis TaxID=2921223 RepID=UPI002166B5F5|nr:GSK3-beta interaction protein [Anthonomus grandis grandis]